MLSTSLTYSHPPWLQPKALCSSSNYFPLALLLLFQGNSYSFRSFLAVFRKPASHSDLPCYHFRNAVSQQKTFAFHTPVIPSLHSGAVLKPEQALCWLALFALGSMEQDEAALLITPSVCPSQGSRPTKIHPTWNYSLSLPSTSTCRQQHRRVGNTLLPQESMSGNMEISRSWDLISQISTATAARLLEEKGKHVIRVVGVHIM